MEETFLCSPATAEAHRMDPEAALSRILQSVRKGPEKQNVEIYQVGKSPNANFISVEKSLASVLGLLSTLGVTSPVSHFRGASA